MSIYRNKPQLWGYMKRELSGAELFAPRNQRSGGYGGMMPTYPLTFTGWQDRNPNPSLTRAQAAITSWVYSDVQVLSREFAAANLSIQKIQGEKTTEEINHPFEARWNQPNPYMGKSFLMLFWQMSMLLSGKAFLYFAPLGNSNTIAEVWPIPPHMVKVIPDAKVFMRYMYYSAPDADPMELDPRYICYSHLPHPQDLRQGLAPLDAAMLAVNTDNAMAKWQQAFFDRKKAIPDALITLPQHIQEGEFQTIKAEILEGLFGNGIGIGFARSGDLKMDAFGFDMQKIQQIESRIASRNEIDRIFGIPEGYWSADASRANSDHAGDAVLGNVVHPYHVMLAEDLTSQILPIFYGDQLQATFDDIRPRNVDLLLRQTETRSKYWTIDELRESDGKEKLNDYRGRMFVSEVGAFIAPPMMNANGDAPQSDTAPADQPAQLPAAGGADVQAQALNGAQIASLLEVVQAVQGGDLAPDAARIVITQSFPTIPPDEISQMIAAATAFKPKQIEAPQPPPAQNMPPQTAPDAQGGAVDKPQPPQAKSIATDALYVDLERWQAKSLKSLKNGKPAAVKFESDHIAPDVAAIINAQLSKATNADDVRKVVAGAAFLKRDDPFALTPEEQALYDDLVPVFAQYGGQFSADVRAGREPSYDDLDSDLQDAIRPVLEKHAYGRMGALEAEFGLDVPASATAAGEWASKYVFDLIGGLNDTTRTIVQRAVSSYMDTPNMTRGDVEALLSPAFGANRAESIAVTEITRAAAAGTDIYETQLNDAGFETKQVWASLRDELVCPICGPLNGKTDAEWGEIEGPPAHPRCRCSSTIQVVKK